jgi:pilus assembly protein FimV
MEDVSIGVDLDLDLDAPPSAAASSAAAAKAVPPNTSGSVADLDFDTGFESPPTTQGTQSSSSSAYANKKEDMIDFDMGSLSLDLESEVASTAQTLAANAQGPLETKLALAEEFVSIGDQDGARGLIEEVLSEAQGELRSKAQRLLSSLH